MTSTLHEAFINAPPEKVYRALLDPQLIPEWRVPPGMRCEVHEFEARVGGMFRISLTYDAPDIAGKSSEHTDTYHGRFEELVPNQRVVETLEFETTDPAMQGEMRITTVLTAERGGTRLRASHEHLPPGVQPADNEAGWRDSLTKLAALLESGRNSIAAYLGTWTLLPELSLYSVGTPPSAGAYVIEQETTGTLSLRVRWQMPGDNTEHTVQFGAPPDGTRVPVEGATTGPDALTLTHIDAHTLDSTALRGSVQVAYARRVVSADGSLLAVVQETGQSDGARLRNFQVYRREKASP